ncbi:TraR/DksA family transcriptional regulator [Caldimonas sp. KR1-144]|uniref:TraR/DksA family transcriptional regulator n=1 Tax=Caldimonas sp. KR1-144 TaxID=3400911 RepID=UPI003BFC685F
MDPATQTHLPALRQSLLERLRELQAELSVREPQPLDSTDVGDLTDTATQREFETLHQAEEQRDADELGAVRAALERMNAGRYGDCADCGEPIPLQRLLVQPAAERCTACQTAHEQAHAVSSAG